MTGCVAQAWSARKRSVTNLILVDLVYVESTKHLIISSRRPRYRIVLNLKAKKVANLL
jgi:hypothetical protein